MSCRSRAVVAAAGFVALAAAAQAADYAGTYRGQVKGQAASIDLSAGPAGGYAGTIHLGAATLPCRATDQGDHLAGTFANGEASFPFTATLDGDALTFATGRSTYRLSRTPAAAAANPLDGPVAAAPVAGPAPVPGPDDAGRFAGFQVLGATPTGQVLFVQLPAATSLDAAVTQAADALAKGLDAKPTLGKAFADGHDRRRGGISLAAKRQGHDCRGAIFVGPGQQGWAATVVLATADAPKADVAELFACLPAPAPKGQAHAFPDGSGSIDLPDGWTTPTTSAAHGVTVRGPAGQSVVICNIVNVYDPNCRVVRQSQQVYAMKAQQYDRQMRRYDQALAMHQRFPNTPSPIEPTKPVPPDADPNVAFPGMRFCEFCDGPEAVLRDWYPFSEAIERRAGGRYSTLDKVIEVIPLPGNPAQPGSKAGLAYLAVTDHDGARVTHVRVVNRIATANILPGEQWQLMFCNMRAPDDTFDRDLPVMQAIMNSVQVNGDVVGREVQAEGDAVRKMGADTFAAQQRNSRAFQDQQAASFNAHEQQIAAREKAVHDSSSDFIEYVGGVRHVYDTQAGRQLDVDLFNSDAITDALNAAANDPTRFVQVPLRYER